MSTSRDVRIELIKLRSGERVIRLSEQHLGLSLEKILNSGKPVVRQKNELMSVFQAALERLELTAA
jgi:hypothetical protein